MVFVYNSQIGMSMPRHGCDVLFMVYLSQLEFREKIVEIAVSIFGK